MKDFIDLIKSVQSVSPILFCIAVFFVYIMLNKKNKNGTKDSSFLIFGKSFTNASIKIISFSYYIQILTILCFLFLYMYEFEVTNFITIIDIISRLIDQNCMIALLYIDLNIVIGNKNSLDESLYYIKNIFPRFEDAKMCVYITGIMYFFWFSLYFKLEDPSILFNKNSTIIYFGSMMSLFIFYLFKRIVTEEKKNDTRTV